MAKNYSNRNRKRKALIAMLCALSVTCTGFAAACVTPEEEEPSTAVTAKEDVQLLKNGNFEHFDIPDKAVHLIKNVNSWSLGGDTSVKSGIIGTSKSDWDKLTDPELAATLDYNNDLSTDNEEYVNYNSMRSRDILYRDTYAAQLDDVDDTWVTKHDDGHQGYFGIEGNEEDGYTWNGKEAKLIDGEFYIKDDDGSFTRLIRKELIENPETHWGEFSETDGEYKFGSKTAYQDENGNYYFDEDMEKDPVGNVLMIHNGGVDSDNKSYHQYYTSNSVTLEAHTSAEISLWVKTSDLKFNKGYAATAEEEDKGAYIEVIQSVANKSVDSFKIKAINTQNIISSAKEKGVTTTESNGWIQYTVYVNACDFANTSIQLRLGLGGSQQNEKVTGYAFFDDVQVKKYRDLSKDESYADAKVENTTCTLTSEKEDKIFYADVNTKDPEKLEKGLNTYDFNYKIDLASITDSENKKHTYSSIAFGDNVEVGLTTEKNSKDVEYAAAERIDANTKIEGVGKKKQPDDGYSLPKDLKNKPRPTDEDIIKAFDKNFTFNDDYAYHVRLNNLTGDENGAPGLTDTGNTLVMFSAWGAPYTATLTDETAFKIAKDDYLLVSFWVKTSDMNGGTAATAKIYELNKKGLVDEDSVKTLKIDTTNKTTDFEDEKDIYKGWVQCFFFVKNETDEDKTFKIDFSFGTSAITTTTSYESGYAAFANLQTLEIDEDIYKLASSSDTTALFSFSKEAEKDNGKVFDEANATSDIDKGIALPSNYTGVNGGKVLGSAVDKTLSAGLINKDYIDDYTGKIDKTYVFGSFSDSLTEWNDVFGEDCYQPLIIINSLRDYATKADANKTNFKEYWIKNDDGTYEKVAADAEYNDKETYYSLNKVANYGFISEEKTVSSNGREVVSVRVKVSGNAKAYIYLVDSDDTDKILNYTTPSYTFWYDEEGNVLDEELDENWTTAEHRTHIVYTLREDGLYEDKDGKLFANLYNLVKSYKDGKYERVEYYDENGEPIKGGYDYVEKHDGETFYKEDGTVADHYLCATDGTHVYECIDGKYYYVEITKTDDKTTETTNLDKEVNNFDTTPRYTKPEIAEELFVTVSADECDPASENHLCDEYGWVTVNFVIKAGSEAKDYRLALWSGERDKDGVESYDPDKKGAVAFDYVHGTVSESRLATYETEIVNAYNNAFEKHALDVLKEETSLGRDANIADYEAVLASDKLTADEKKDILAEMASYNYKASYYTYTLYDSAAYVPFNATTAGDGETGYNYDASSFSEQLAYFKFEDTSEHQKNVFVDYSAVDQSFTKNTVSDDNDEEEESKNNSAELGLYISSIVLVVVLLITLVSILLMQFIRKRRKTSAVKNSSKNVYRKRDRYVKKLHLVKDEMVEPENGESDVSDVPAEEVTPVENEVTEVPAEETTETVEPSSTEETTETPDGEDKE